ncbi:hypothetical protein NQ318_012266 [Aromia moschata]|uniref:Mos1 transposase HTH domain-containing protein n=1 Tax=Aromia moschata TaxID=1265417 RepID=A0AAV8XFQ8_9CUCU|nr:hypothetical protein NQ318_012266 [Aromia moschata]
MLNEVYGNECLSRTQVFEWGKRFKEERETTEDDPLPGRPSTSKTDEKLLYLENPTFETPIGGTEDTQQRIVNKIEEINGTSWILQHIIDSVKIRAQTYGLELQINFGRLTTLPSAHQCLRFCEKKNEKKAPQHTRHMYKGITKQCGNNLLFSYFLYNDSRVEALLCDRKSVKYCKC